MGNSLDKSEDWRNNSKSNINKKSARQTYRPDSVDRLAPAGNHSSGHPIAEMLKPPTRMLERAALRGRNRTHAYLVLLRVEVAAFHTATPAPPWAMRTPRSNRGGVCLIGTPSLQTRLCGPVPQPNRARERTTDRTAVSRYPALWSPDLPRCRKHRDCPVCLAPELYG